MNAFSSPTSAPMQPPPIPFPSKRASDVAFSSLSGGLAVDIAVIGASVAGLFVAQGLSRLGYRCALIGPDPPLLRQKSGFDQRIFAISPSSWDWMTQQGLSAAIDAARVGVIDRMHLEAPPGQVRLQLCLMHTGLRSINSQLLSNNPSYLLPVSKP